MLGRKIKQFVVEWLLRTILKLGILPATIALEHLAGLLK